MKTGNIGLAFPIRTMIRNHPIRDRVLMLPNGNLHFKSIAGTVNYMSSDRYRSNKITEMIAVVIQNIESRLHNKQDHCSEREKFKQRQSFSGLFGRGTFRLDQKFSAFVKSV